MSNHKWTKIKDALPPLDQAYLAYMPTSRNHKSKVQVAIDRKNANGGRLTVVGNTFAWDQAPITKWILLEEIMPNPEED